MTYITIYMCSYNSTCFFINKLFNFLLFATIPGTPISLLSFFVFMALAKMLIVMVFRSKVSAALGGMPISRKMPKKMGGGKS